MTLPTSGPRMEQEIREATSDLLRQIPPTARLILGLAGAALLSELFGDILREFQKSTARRCAETIEGKCGCRVKTIGIDVHTTACIARRRAAQDLRVEFALAGREGEEKL